MMDDQVMVAELRRDDPPPGAPDTPRRSPLMLVAVVVAVLVALWLVPSADGDDPAPEPVAAVDSIQDGPAAVRDIAVGRGETANTLWMASPNGVWVLWQSGGIHHWNHYTIQEGLPPAPIDHVEIAPDGSVWVANPSGVSVHRDGRWAGVAGGDAPTGAYALAIDPDGGVWAGWDAVYALADGSWKRHTEPVGDVPTGSDAIVTELAVDGDGAVWAAVTFDRWEPETGALYRFESGRWREVPLPRDGLGLITAMAVDPDGSPWVVFDSLDGDPLIARSEGDGWEVLDSVEADIQAMAVGGDGSVWLASGFMTEGSYEWQGLTRYRGESTQRLLGGIAVSTVFPTEDGAVWIGGDGLYRLKAEAGPRP